MCRLFFKRVAVRWSLRGLGGHAYLQINGFILRNIGFIYGDAKVLM
jgi:hypothetical protein